MFEVMLPSGRLITVKFDHVRPDLGYKGLFPNEGDAPFTQCSIRTDILDGDKVAVSTTEMGFAQCHPNDNFEKSIGRAVSLTRALHTFVEVEDGEVNAILDAYDEAHNTPFYTVKDAIVLRDYLNRYISAIGKA